MSAQTLRGTLVPLLQRSVLRFNPDSGWTADSQFASFSPAQIQYLYQQYAAVGCEVEMTSQGGRYELMVKDSRGDVKIDRWEIGVDYEQPSLLQNPKIISDINDEQKMYILAYVLRNGLKSWAEGYAALLGDDEFDARFPAVPNFTALDFRILDMMLGDQTQYERGSLVLIHDTNVSNRYQANIAEENEYCIYNHSQLLSEVLSTSAWVFPLPDRLEYKITSFYNRQMPVARDFYLWGWLKSISPERTCANMRVEIQTRYKLAQWSEDVYPLAS